EKSLIVAFELVVEAHATHGRPTTPQPLGAVQVGSIQLRVVRQLLRLHDTGIELLARSRRTSTSMAFEQLAPSLGQRHQRRLLAPQDIVFCVAQPLPAEPSHSSLS